MTPADIRPAYPFKRSNGEPIVVAIHQGEIDWAMIEASLQAICDAIEQPTISPNMRLLTRQLGADGAAVGGDPRDLGDIKRLCHVLLLDEQAGESAHSALGERFDRQAPWFRAIVHLVGGELALERWLAGEQVATQGRAQLRALLAACLEGSLLAPDAVLEACKLSFSTEQVRERLGLDFAAFNFSLVETGGAPDIDPEGQTSQLSSHVAEHEIAILDALRNWAAPRLDAFEPCPEYARLRCQFRQLKPDPAWALTYRRVPEPLLARTLAAWLAEVGAPPLDSNPHGLASVTKVREANTPLVRKFARRAAPLVRAWATMHAVSAHEIWRDVVDSDARLRASLDEAGAFDFKPLDDAALLRWCGVLGLWPSAMLSSLDRTALGIAETDLEVVRQQQHEEQARREAEARSVAFKGKPIDPLAADWDALSAEIAAGLPRAIKTMAIGTMAELLPGAVTKPRRSSGVSGGGGPHVPVPKDKIDMIGRLGELVVYHWLKGRLPRQDIDSAWISGNSTVVTGRTGDDSKGYDFEIDYRRQKWFIEVKASTGDPCSFELGETEVRRVREVAQSRAAQRYVIAYVGNVGSPGEVILAMLPNPMSAEADGLVHIVGQGIRYAFAKRSL